MRDLFPWMVDLAERDQAGIYNTAGPVTPVNWEQVLQALAKLSSQPVPMRWATAEVLQKTGIRLPLVRSSSPKIAGSVHVVSTAAQAAGLRYLPLAETAADTLAWWRSQPEPRRAACQADRPG